jgi:hypothetical protein
MREFGARSEVLNCRIMVFHLAKLKVIIAHASRAVLSTKQLRSAESIEAFVGVSDER